MQDFFMEIVKQYTECPVISMDMSIKKDLFMDSLTFTKLIIELEEYYGIEFDDDSFIIGDDIKLYQLFSALTGKLGVA